MSDCPVCGGSGVLACQPYGPAMTAPCRHCDGSGRAPREPQPVWSVRVLAARPSSITTDTTAHLVTINQSRALCGAAIFNRRPALGISTRCADCQRKSEAAS